MKLMVIRHSDREQINNSETAHLAQLTDKGIRNAMVFGTLLGDKFNVKLDQILTSDVERCIDTGILIRDAHALEKFIEKIKLHSSEAHENLAGLGYVKFTKRMEWLDYIGKKFKSGDLDYGTIFKELFENNISMFREPKDYAKLFLTQYYYRFHNTLVVTHDTNIGPLMYAFSKKYSFYLDNSMLKPKPLCGFCFSKKNFNTVLEWISYENEDIKLKRLV